MPRQRRIDPFFLVLKDEDRDLFTVVGPMTDDTPWINRVCQAQDQGRQVRCFTPGASQTREQVIANVKQELKLKYTDEVFL
jgi:hypothetical protein